MMEKKTITFEHCVSPLSQSLPSTHDRCSEQTADHKHFTHSTLAVHFLLALIRPQKFNPKSQVFPSIFLRQSVVDLFKWKKKKEKKSRCIVSAWCSLIAVWHCTCNCERSYYKKKISSSQPLFYCLLLHCHTWQLNLCSRCLIWSWIPSACQINKYLWLGVMPPNSKTDLFIISRELKRSFLRCWKMFSLCCGRAHVWKAILLWRSVFSHHC